MKAIQILSREHILIHQMLAQMINAREKLERHQFPPELFFEKAVQFSKNFADGFHHFKEEFLLFGLLAYKKNGALDTDIGALRYQHERCRYFIQEIEKALKGYSQKDEIATTILLENLAAYIALLTRHIYIEDHVFFPIIEPALSKQEAESMLDQFYNEEKRLGEEKGLDASQRLITDMENFLR